MKKLNSIYEISFSKFRILVQNSLGWKDRERLASRRKDNGDRDRVVVVVVAAMPGKGSREKGEGNNGNEKGENRG